MLKNSTFDGMKICRLVPNVFISALLVLPGCAGIITSIINDDPSLHLAEYAGQGDQAGVDKLLADGGDVNAVGPQGETPLSAAAANGRTEMMRYLISRKANVNDGKSLEGAAARDQTEAIRILLTAGANVNVRGFRGRTALMVAASAGKEKAVQELLRAGADKDLKDDDGETALDRAQKNNRRAVVDLLMKNTRP